MATPKSKSNGAIAGFWKLTHSRRTYFIGQFIPLRGEDGRTLGVYNTVSTIVLGHILSLWIACSRPSSGV